MKTFKEFLTTFEEYREPDLEKMRKKADKISRDSDEYKKVSDFFHQEREKDVYKKKPVSRNPNRRAYYRDTEGNIKRGYHSGDLLSLQNKHKFDTKKRTQELGRREQNIRAKINQYHADPLGYMAKEFGLGRNDYGMEMRRAPKKRKVEEGYKEPNLDKMERKAKRFDDGKISFDRSFELSGARENLYKGRKNVVNYDHPDLRQRSWYKQNKQLDYDRSTLPHISRGVNVNDLESINRYEKYRNMHNLLNSERRANNIRAKIKQHSIDPLGYMSKSFGGPTINPEGWEEGENKKRKQRRGN